MNNRTNHQNREECIDSTQNIFSKELFTSLNNSEENNFYNSCNSITNFIANSSSPFFIQGTKLKVNEDANSESLKDEKKLNFIVEQNEIMRQLINDLIVKVSNLQLSISVDSIENEFIPFNMQHNRKDAYCVIDNENFIINSEPEINSEIRPKIVVYGYSFLNSSDIIEIIKRTLSNIYNIIIHSKDISVLVSHSSKYLKNNSPAVMLQNNNYDYMIVGPHPHAVKGKNIKHQWEKFLSIRKIPTKVFESYGKSLSKTQIKELAHKIGQDWQIA